jgi:hypothetical protein
MNKISEETASIDEINRKKINEYSRRIIEDLSLDEKRPSTPRFNTVYKLVKDYENLTSDIAGTIDLILLYIEQAIDFSNDYCYCEEDIEDAICLAVEDLKKIFAQDTAGKYRRLFNKEILKIYELQE